ncbi:MULTISPECIES: hypothetical protein [Thermoactinomyces]|uniref:Uncharacterized protein n=1 Tax=Thermoactinomyces daqus TaxID=1329516 RepID=A0A7W2AJJ7_9BACL|nr:MULTISPECIES: hypothetical protein [Thermoactinomyces]MBA4544470.1 hypothetical protein [Thermoactinomyces daqus]MBH8609145.1 hypothetical protein [Thermoactinomyces sp. CICC 10521]
MLRFNEYGYLPPGIHEMTIDELKESILVKGDESVSVWNEPWRRYLVLNLEVLLQPLWQLGFDEVFLDGSFCSIKEKPGDIDAYFELDLKVENRYQALEQVYILAHELNSLSTVPVWNWWEKRPNADGEMKSEMWHQFRCEVYPNCYGVYAFQNQDGGRIKFDQLFRYDENGIEKGIVKLLLKG